MLRFFTIFLIIWLSLKLNGQSNVNNALKFRINEKTLNQEFTILVQGNIVKLKNNIENLNYRINYYAGNIASVTLDLISLSKLIENKTIAYAEFNEPHKQVMNDTMVIRNRIQGVKTGTPPLLQAYNGSGVVVGIIDTGTDWRHEDFKDAFGNTRIKFIWDQNIPNGPSTPQPYNYGVEWTAAQINASVCTHDDATGNSHGTHVTGIAAGNGMATGKFEGCAPKADIIVVALNFNLPGPTIADAVQYIFSKATAMGQPCVINASVGDYYGSHDGTDLEAKLIENMVKNIPGRVMVAAAGNAGLARFHTKTIPSLNDTTFTWMKNANADLYYWCYADTQQIKNVRINIGANRNNYFNLGSIGFKNYNYGLLSLQTDTLKFNGNRIGIVKTSASINSYGVYELFVHVKADTANLLWRIESKGNGLHHAWNFDFVGANLPSLLQYPRMGKYVKPDTLYSIVSSFQCLEDITTVANYNNLSNYYDVNNVLQSTGKTGGSRFPDSSIGPTRDGRQKPDIAATGHGVFAALCKSLQANFLVNIPQFLSPGGKHVFGTGTSAASPVVAGFAALFLQYYPNATSFQVKKVITNCAYTDGFTGNLMPDYAWGYGKLDGVAAMQCGILTGKNEAMINDISVNYFPNPFNDKVNIKFKSEVNGEIYVYTSEGKLIFEDKVSANTYELKSDNFNYNGLLFIRVVSANGNISFKLVCAK